MFLGRWEEAAKDLCDESARCPNNETRGRVAKLSVCPTQAFCVPPQVAGRDREMARIHWLPSVGAHSADEYFFLLYTEGGANSMA